MGCSHMREVGGVAHCCERPDGHTGDHVFALTAGQIHALKYQLEHPKAPSFPGEAVLLMVSAFGVSAFAGHRSALDWGVSLVMFATAIRWIRQWQEERHR